MSLAHHNFSNNLHTRQYKHNSKKKTPAMEPNCDNYIEFVLTMSVIATPLHVNTFELKYLAMKVLSMLLTNIR